ncbi:MAG: type IX secretion system membrane protein PorP/SprF [Bacteroidales bacterium]|nr:type IX secretion system membrane protein PorP/SprF [Bacteroidales bacterium]
MRFRVNPHILYLLLLVFLLQSVRMSAQYDAQLSQYMLAPGTFNPAAAGQGSDMNYSLVNRQQWVGIDHAPSTFVLHASMPFSFNNRKNGFGLIVFKESIGLFSTQLIQLQYAYKKKLKHAELSIGLQGGLLQENFDADEIYIPEKGEYHSSTDESIPTGSLKGSIPDFSLGVWYDHNIYYAGLSISHLMETSIKLKAGEDATDEGSYKIKASRTYYLTNGYNIILSNPLYTVQPSFLLKTDLTAWQFDLSGRVFYKEHYWGGLGWRYQDAIIVMAGIKLRQGLSIGYSYDISTSAVASFSGGSHEIFIGYIKKIGTATVSKKQKSVRIL